MTTFLKKIKKSIKNNAFIYDLYESYIVRFEYGYLHSKSEIKRFLRSLPQCKEKFLYDEKKINHIIIIGDKNLDSTLRKAVFGDIDLGNVRDYKCDFYTTRILKNEKWGKIHRLFFRINKYVPLLGKDCWEKLYTTSDIKVTSKENVFFVFMAGAYYEETFSQPKLLTKIHQFQNETYCKKILYMVDPIDKYPKLPMWFPYFDHVASYSHADEKKYHTAYIDSPCVRYNLTARQSVEDIYFRAMDSGRAQLVKECFEYLEQHGVKCNFHVQTTDKRHKTQPGMEFSNSRVSYEIMLEEEVQANVMLEVIIPGVGSGTTLRYKEAIMYGKKLLTNNPDVKSLELYNPQYIKYFEKPEDIDVNWVKKIDNVDYGYQGEFSTDAFCKKIIDLYR